MRVQKLSIRLLRSCRTPNSAVREGVCLLEWPKIEGALIALDSVGGNAPKWAHFLELSEEEKRRIVNRTAYGLVFVRVDGRWFAIAFGMGHVKLDPAAFEQDFGLRVVLNAVDPERLRSIDVRTPDENTLSRRSQTSRGSDQSAFGIDVERDIVRGLAGTPRDNAFASRVAGTDALSMDRKLKLADLTAVCAMAHDLYQRSDYKTEFGWIDQIRHIRDKSLIDKLDTKIAEALDKAVKDHLADHIHLAFPVIYDPEKTSFIRYKGFRSRRIHADLDINNYLDDLRQCDRTYYSKQDLEKHTVHEVDDSGRDCGRKWKIRECLVFETKMENVLYVLSGGRWYRIDKKLAEDVVKFFDGVPRIELPKANMNENESAYNNRISLQKLDMICLDKKLIIPTGASTKIEVCDFLSLNREFIHIKGKTSSSRLSHLFSQGTVSARVMATDPLSRKSVREVINTIQTETGRSGYEDLLPKADEDFRRGEYTVVYAVIGRGKEARLPFFSLVSFRQAARELQALGYKYAFSWIEKSNA